MAYTEVTRTGYMGRIGNAIKGVIFGGVLFFVSFIILFWNEGRAVHTARTLEEGKSAVVPVDSAKVDPANEGKLIHFTGKAINATGEKLVDPVFKVSQDAIHLKRDVQMYQWKETKKTETHKDAVGGGQTEKTTYTYSKVWDPKPIDSSVFDQHDRENHDNPSQWRLSSSTLDAANVTAGAFTINPDLVGKIDNYTPVTVSAETVDGLPADLKGDSVYSNNTIFVSNSTGAKPDPTSAEIGDLKVAFTTVLPGDVSVIAKQTGSTVTPYQTKNNALELLYVGNHSAAEMFASEESKNATLTWILRLGGFVAMWVGLALMLAPLKVLADVVGIIGDLVGAGIGIVTGLVAIALSFTTIAIAWLTYRPLVGVGLLVIAAAAVAGFFVLRSKGAAKKALAAPPPQPLPQ